MKRFWQHPWVCAAGNILLVMAIYTLSRLFFYLISPDLFPNVSTAHLWEMLLGGMRFDLTAVLYLSAGYLLLTLLPLPVEWRNNGVYQRIAKYFFLIPNAIGIAVNCIDMVYVRFTDRRTTITFFDEFAQDHNLLSIFAQGVVQYWYVSLFAIAMIAAMVLLYRSSRCHTANAVKYYIRETVLLCVSVFFIVIGMRGGFGRYTRPITLSNALQYTNRPQETLLVLNTPFCLMRSTEGRSYTDPQYFAPEELETIMTPIHENEGVKELRSEGVKELRNEGVKELRSEGVKELRSEGVKELRSEGVKELRNEGFNVVVIILESFATEHIRPYAPFLDSLLAQSVTWEYSFAAGRKSIDAMPSVLSSIPMLIDPYVVTPYSTNAVSSIADCLGREGYTTAFFHGAPNGSMGFQAYARSAGFGAYYGIDEYPHAKRDFDGTWAIWDEPFLQFFGQTMSTMPEPFMTAVFTASSHHPFSVPAQYEGVFPEGTQPIHRCIGYSDYALRQFFAYAKTQPWFAHTLFVLTADHTNQLEHTNALGLYRVPIAFYCPALLTAEQRHDIVSQTDIMPSVLGAVGYDKPFFAFGEDALTQQKAHNYAVCYHHPLFQIMSDSLLVQFDGQQVTAVYDYIADPCLQHPLPTNEASQEMVRYLKAYIQQYIHRMIHNELTYE